MGIGFWKGKMEMKLEKYSFRPGERIKGELSLKLKKPTKARGVTIRLLGEEKITERSHSSSKGSSTNTKTIKICDIKIPLDGEKEYTEGRYDFDIPIPADLVNTVNKPDGVLGDIVDVVERIGGDSRRIEWHVIGNIDIPMGFDLSKKQDIVVDLGR